MATALEFEQVSIYNTPLHQSCDPFWKSGDDRQTARDGDAAEVSTALEFEQVSNYNTLLHQSCGPFLKNGDDRQTARDGDAAEEATILEFEQSSNYLQHIVTSELRSFFEKR